MSEDLPPIERLDLRFKAPANRAQSSWLPGSVWVWFAIGIAAGILGWHLGHQQLAEHLGLQVQPHSSPTDALLALEALDSLNSNEQNHFVIGLAHPDLRVARSATQILFKRIERWPGLDATDHHKEIRSLANLLDSLPKDLPEDNRTLIRSLAARLFSICVSLDDPQLQTVTQVCQRVMSTDVPPRETLQGQTRLAVAQSIPPEPLPKFTDTSHFRLSDEPRQELDSASGGHAALLPSGDAGEGNSESVRRDLSPQDSPLENPGVIADTSDYPTDAKFNSLRGQDSPHYANQAADSQQDNDSPASEGFVPPNSASPMTIPPELPVLVSTPASIASQPVVRMRVVSNQPNLDGLAEAKPAELVRLLASPHANVAKGAALSLRHHGFSDSEISLASELAVGSAERRLELVKMIAGSSQLTPQPWLVWMAEDGQPEVRRMSISLLSSMLTDEVQRSLRMLLYRESDQEIQDLIRRVLLSGSQR